MQINGLINTLMQLQIDIQQSSREVVRKENIREELLKLTEQREQVQAVIKTIDAENKVLGTLIDTMA